MTIVNVDLGIGAGRGCRLRNKRTHAGRACICLLGLLDIDCFSLQIVELEAERLQAQAAAEESMQAQDARKSAYPLL